MANYNSDGQSDYGKAKVYVEEGFHTIEDLENIVKYAKERALSLSNAMNESLSQQ